jgi:DNA-binding NarL/FixJ family response regulator
VACTRGVIVVTVDITGAPAEPIRRSDSRPLPPQPGFVNRVRELSVLAEEADRASRGEPRVVYVSGTPGIGKTALVNAFLEHHPKLLRVLVAGAEAETAMHLGVAKALRQALAAHAGQPADPAMDLGTDPLACGAALVGLLGLAQGRQRVIALVVDDLDWLDPASVVALAFALRRLNTDRILTVLAGRGEIQPDTPLGRVAGGPHGRHLRIGGLDTSAVRELAARVSPHVSATQAATLLAHTGGNPLYLQALLAELPPGGAVDAYRLPAPKAFAAAALAPLDRAPEPSRRLIAAAAVLGMEARLADAAQMTGVVAPVKAAEAAPANLVKLIDGPLGWVLRFTHPLNRAAVYHDLPPAERARLHGLAAEHTFGRPALWHRLRAASSPDPALAGELAAAAAGAASQGQFGSAADDLAAAAQVHPDPAARQRLVLDAADLRLWASDPGAADALLATVEEASGARWHYVHGHTAAVAGRVPQALAELQAGWDRIGPGDADLRGPIASLLSQICLVCAQGETSALWAARALDYLPPGHPLASMSRAYRALGLWIAGKNRQATASLAGLPADPAAVTAGDAAQLAVRGQLRLWSDDLAGARADCEWAMRLGRQTGLPVFVLTAAGYLAETEYRLGEWDDAVVHGDLAVSLVDDTDQLWLRVFAHSVAALVWAARGGWSVAEEHVNTARATASRLGSEASHAYAANAAAHLGFARQDWPAIVAAGSPLYRLDSRDGAFEPGVLGWRQLYDEALVAVGRVADARRDLDESLRVAADRGRRSVLARLGRPQAALALADGDAERARRALETGIEHASAACGPFDQALLHDALGRMLRRMGQRRQAACHLQAAHDRYSRLRAIPFLGRCGEELAACGLRPARRVPRTIGLSPREQAVGRLVARGLTNRQIASELVISVKTVEYHLGSAFTKLGVSTRTQLAAKLGQGRKD